MPYVSYLRFSEYVSQVQGKGSKVFAALRFYTEETEVPVEGKMGETKKIDMEFGETLYAHMSSNNVLMFASVASVGVPKTPENKGRRNYLSFQFKAMNALLEAKKANIIAGYVGERWVPGTMDVEEVVTIQKKMIIQVSARQEAERIEKLTEIKVGEDVITFHAEGIKGKSDYLLHATVKGLPDEFMITGSSKADIIARAPAAIEKFKKTKEDPKDAPEGSDPDSTDVPVAVLEFEKYHINVFKEEPGEDPKEDLQYKFYAEVAELPGCFIVGNTNEEILEQAPEIIKEFLEVQKEQKEKDKPPEEKKVELQDEAPSPKDTLEVKKTEESKSDEAVEPGAPEEVEPAAPGEPKQESQEKEEKAGVAQADPAEQGGE